jgi:hypothetical protein
MMCTTIFCGLRVIVGSGLEFYVAKVCTLSVEEGGKVLGWFNGYNSLILGEEAFQKYTSHENKDVMNFAVMGRTVTQNSRCTK